MKRIFTIFLFLIVAVSAMAQAGRVKELPKTFEIDSISQMLGANYPVGTRVVSKGLDGKAEAIYYVSPDSIIGYKTDSIAVIPLQSGNYAIIQDIGGRWNARNFGAIPNDGIDDRDEANKMVNWVLNKRGSQVLYFPAGQYDFPSGGIEVWDDRDGDGVVTRISNITITGEDVFPYSANESDILTKFRFSNRTTFGIAVQRGAGITIKNLHITGDGFVQANSWERMYTYPDSLIMQPSVRDNRWSPYCAIAIDPFDNATLLADQYPGYSLYYQEQSNTSDFKIQNVRINDWTVGIGNLGDDGNGDYVVMDRIWMNQVKSGYATRNNQSRSCMITNWRSNNLVQIQWDTKRYGAGVNGVMPEVQGANIAGITKQLYINGGFSYIHFSNIFAEDIFSIGTSERGIWEANFVNCYFRIHFPGESGDRTLANYALLVATQANFDGCTIRYYRGFDYWNQLRFRVDQLSFNNCSLEFPVANFWKDGFQGYREVEYNNCNFNLFEGGGWTQNAKKELGSTEQNLRSIYMTPNRKFNIGSKEIKYTGAFPEIEFLEFTTLTIDTANARAEMVVSDPTDYYDSFQGGQYWTQSITNKNAQEDYLLELAITDNWRSTLGSFYSMSNDTLTIENVHYGVSTSNNVFVQRYVKWKPVTLGNIVSGTNFISEAETATIGGTLPGNSLTLGNVWLVGDFIDCDDCPTPNYVTSISNDTIYTAKNFTSTGVRDFYQTTDLEIRAQLSGEPTTGSWRKGSVIYNDFTGSSDVSHWVCTRSGIMGSSIQTPLFQEVSTLEEGTADGQLAYWDATDNRWKHTEQIELHWDDATKRFGIGKVGASSPLHVASAGGANSGLTIQSTSASQYATTDWLNSTGDLAQMIMAGASFSTGMVGNRSANFVGYGSGGLNLIAGHASGSIRFGAGGLGTTNEVGSFSSDGIFSLLKYGNSSDKTLSVLGKTIGTHPYPIISSDGTLAGETGIPEEDIEGLTNPNGGANTIQSVVDSLALTYSLFPAITYTPTDSIPIDTVLQSFPITSRLDGDTLRQITYTVTKAPTVNLDIRVLIWDGSTYTAAFSGTIPAGSRSVSVSGAVAVAIDERIFPEILTDSGASGLDLELKFQKP